MDIGTVIAIVVPNVVTAVALFLTWKQHGRTLTAERELTDLAAVRDVLDETAVALQRAYAILEGTNTALFLHDITSALEGAGLDQADEDLRASVQDLTILTERLAIRFGRGHAITSTAAEAVRALKLLRTNVTMALLESNTDNREARDQLRSHHARAAPSSTNPVRDFLNAYEEFIGMAERLAGARLSWDRRAR